MNRLNVEIIMRLWLLVFWHYLIKYWWVIVIIAILILLFLPKR